MAMAAPVAASVGRAAAGKAAQSAGGKAAQSAAGKGAQAAAGGAGGGGKAGAAAAAASGGGGKKKSLGDVDIDVPEKKAGGEKKKAGGKSWGKKQLTTGSAAKYKKALVAEFIICVLLLGLSPFGRPSGELGPIRFMKRGSATCAFFVILGITSSFGVGAARAAAMFGGLVTLVLAIDQRSAFGHMATMLNARDEDDKASPSAVGPSDDTDAPPDVVAV